MNAPFRRQAGEAYWFIALACAITWSLCAPAAFAFFEQAAPSPLAVAGAGFSAFGPMFAAMVFAWKGGLRQMFRPWRTNAGWILLALLIPIGLRLLAVAVYAAFGGEPSQWFYPPSTSVQIAALVVFPLGEEFGWRGFAHPRLVGRFGLVKGSLVLGLAWGLWHLAYSVLPKTGEFDFYGFGFGLLYLPLYTVILTWVFERSGRSLAVPITFHAAAHIDHLSRRSRNQTGRCLSAVGRIAPCAADS